MSSDHWLSVTAFSDIELNASSARKQHIFKHGRINGFSLFLTEVARVDQVVRKRLVHIVSQLFYNARIRDNVLSRGAELSKGVQVESQGRRGTYFHDLLIYELIDISAAVLHRHDLPLDVPVEGCQLAWSYHM